MIGRAYDYNLGHLMSIDPLIQKAGNSQSLNAYSYIMTNWLSGTVPTGKSSNAFTLTKNEKWYLEELFCRFYINKDFYLKV